MGKWKQLGRDIHFDLEHDGECMGSCDQARRIRDAHNTDCDTYDARIAELESLLESRESGIREAITQRDDARSKAEENRVKAANAIDAHDAMARRLNPDDVPVDISALCCEIDEVIGERDDALERIAELEAELNRVKAESLRVVVSAERCSLSNCSEKFYIQPSCCHDTKVTPNNIQADFRRHPDTTVLPVCLERWEDEE